MDRKEEMLAKMAGKIQVAVVCLVMLAVTCAASAELSDIIGVYPDEGLTAHRLGDAPDPGDLSGIYYDDDLPGGSPNASNTPEPATLMLLGMGGVALLRCRKRRSQA